MSFITSTRTWLETYRNRALALLAAHLLGYLLLGSAVILPGIPDDEWGTLDQWIRTAVFTAVRPGDTTPVTYVDIDNALYRDTWGMPAVTPRGELLNMLESLAHSGATEIVVDIDLAWGQRHANLANFLENYAGPAPLVFVRHLEETENGIRDVDTPYDEVFIANDAWLHWAHAFFLSDGDGALRDWLPWIPICEDENWSLLPSVAALIADDASPARSADSQCPSVDDFLAYPIVYTEDYGFASGVAREDRDEVLWFPDPNAAARRFPARYMLDDMNVDYNAIFGGRVAVVGGSHTAGQDLRLTPIGVLPGAVIQANTIHHAPSQLASADISEWSHRITVILLFLVLSTIAFPVAAMVVILVAAIAAGVFAYFAIFGQIQNAALLFVQFRILAWLLEPFWKNWKESGWLILLPDYIRDEQEE